MQGSGQLRRQHLIWALESSRGCYYTGLGAAILFYSSTALLWISDYTDIGLPFCFMALLWISLSTACATCDLLVISFLESILFLARFELSHTRTDGMLKTENRKLYIRHGVEASSAAQVNLFLRIFTPVQCSSACQESACPAQA